MGSQCSSNSLTVGHIVVNLDDAVTIPAAAFRELNVLVGSENVLRGQWIILVEASVTNICHFSIFWGQYTLLFKVAFEMIL